MGPSSPIPVPHFQSFLRHLWVRRKDLLEVGQVHHTWMGCLPSLRFSILKTISIPFDDRVPLPKEGCIIKNLIWELIWNIEGFFDDLICSRLARVDRGWTYLDLVERAPASLNPVPCFPGYPLHVHGSNVLSRVNEALCPRLHKIILWWL